MSLFTDPRAVSVEESSSAGSSLYSGASSSASESSVDELVHRALRGEYGPQEHEFSSAALFRAPSPISVQRRERERNRRLGSRYGYRPLNKIFFPEANPLPFPNGRHHYSNDNHVYVEQSSDESLDAGYSKRVKGSLAHLQLQEPPSADGFQSVPRRKPDKQARARLLSLNACASAKVQDKYTRRLAREQEEAAKRRPPRISPIATEAGSRLYLQAKAQRKELEELHKEEVARRQREMLDGCTFQPTISRYAQDLAVDGYQPVQDRLESLQLREEARRREEISLQVEQLAKHSFRPRLSAGTAQIMQNKRQQHSRSAAREPFDPGERLYLDGAERLLRQQLRKRLDERAATRAARKGTLKLSKAGMMACTDRLQAWKRSRDRNMEALREKFEREQLHQRRQSAVGRSDSPPPSTTTTNVPESEAAEPRAVGGHPPFSSRTPVSRNSGTARRYPTPETTKRDSQHRTECTSLYQSEPTRWPRRPEATASPSYLDEKQLAHYRHFRRIRFGALFYKYACSNTSDVVQLSKIKQLVRDCYREDSGMVAALTCVFKQDSMMIRKADFIEALVQFERQHGPQPWGRTAKDRLLFPAAPVTAAVGTPSGGTPRSPSSAASAVPSTVPRSTAEAAATTSRPTSPPASSVRSGSAQHAVRSTPSPASGSYSQQYSSSRPQQLSQPPTQDTHGLQDSRPRSDSRGPQAQLTGPPSCRARTPAHSAQDECTFKPVISKRTVRLSNAERKRRLLRASDTSQRPHHLAPRCAKPTLVTAPCGSGNGGTEVPTRLRSSPSTASQALGLSPSVELSSMTRSTPQRASPSSVVELSPLTEEDAPVSLSPLSAHEVAMRAAAQLESVIAGGTTQPASAFAAPSASKAAQPTQPLAAAAATTGRADLPQSPIARFLLLTEQPKHSSRQQTRMPASCDTVASDGKGSPVAAPGGGVVASSPSNRAAASADAPSKTHLLPDASAHSQAGGFSSPSASAGGLSRRDGVSGSAQFIGGPQPAVRGTDGTRAVSVECVHASAPMPSLPSSQLQPKANNAATPVDVADEVDVLFEKLYKKVCSQIRKANVMGDPFVRPGLEYEPHIEQVLLKHEGTMTLGTTKEDWLRYQRRDTLATIALHRDQLMYLSLAENVPPAKMERILLERMVDPTRKQQ